MINLGPHTHWHGRIRLPRKLFNFVFFTVEPLTHTQACDKKVRPQPNAVIPRLQISMEGRIQALATYKYVRIIVE